MRPAALIVALVAVQVTLGAFTVLSRRDPWINSVHVVCGAMVLTTSLVLTLRSWRGSFACDVRMEPQGAPSTQRRTRRSDLGDLRELRGFTRWGARMKDAPARRRVDPDSRDAAYARPSATTSR